MCNCHGYDPNISLQAAVSYFNSIHSGTVVWFLGICRSTKSSNSQGKSVHQLNPHSRMGWAWKWWDANHTVHYNSQPCGATVWELLPCGCKCETVSLWTT